MSGGRSQNSGIPWPGGDGVARGAGTPGILVLVHFLICGLVTQTCSFCENSPSCALRICAFSSNACHGLMKRLNKNKNKTMSKYSQEEWREGKKKGLGWGICLGITCFLFPSWGVLWWCFKPRFFNLVWITLCCGDGCVPCTTSRSISGLPSLDPINTASSSPPAATSVQTLSYAPPAVKWPDKVLDT